MNDNIRGIINATHPSTHLHIYKYQLHLFSFSSAQQQNKEPKTQTMSPPLPLLDHHIFISNKNTKKPDSGRIDLLLGLALHTHDTAPATLSVSPTTTSYIKHDYEQQQPSMTLSLLFPGSTTQQQNMSVKDNHCEEISSFSNSFVSVKREREDPVEDAPADINDVYEEDVSNIGGSLNGGSGCRMKKKLRLNKQQSALLEDSFKLHTTPNPKQKEALARQLNLRPRQVEVWFQNRRARTKLKQTEVDCEFLKKCCERLAEENEMLHKELQHLKSLNKPQQPFYMHHLPIPSSTRLGTNYMCPSCHHHNQQVLPPNNNNNNFLISSKKRIIFNPFTKAC